MITISYSDFFCTITFERVKKKNALTKNMFISMNEAFDKSVKSPTIKALIIRAQGDYFCAGQDIEEFAKNPQSFNSEHPILHFLSYLESFSKLLICVIDGHAVGIGATMLLHSDFVIAQRNLDISMPFIQMGLCAEAGASQLLEKIIGKSLAREMILLGRPLKSDRFKDTLINELTMSRTQSNAMLKLVKKQISNIPLSGILKNKELMRHRSESTKHTMEREIKSFSFLLNSPETQKIIQSKLNHIKKSNH